MEKPSDDMIRKIIDSGIVHYVNHGGHERIDWDATEKALRRLFEPETALLPCPFCGSEAKLFTPTGDEDQFAVVCQHPENCCNAHILYCASKEDAIEQWNRREAGRWTPELVEEYAEYWFSWGARKSPSEWLRDR